MCYNYQRMYLLLGITLNSRIYVLAIPRRSSNANTGNSRIRSRVVVVPPQEDDLPTGKLYEIYRTTHLQSTSSCKTYCYILKDKIEYYLTFIKRYDYVLKIVFAVLKNNIFR